VWPLAPISIMAGIVMKDWTAAKKRIRFTPSMAVCASPPILTSLLVRMRQAGIEIDDVGIGRDAVVLAANDQHWAMQLDRIDQRQLGDHVDVGTVRHGIAIFQFGRGGRYR